MAVSKRQTVYILFGAFILSIFQFGFIVHTIATSPKAIHPPDPTAMRPFVYGLAGLALLLAIGQSWLRMPLTSTIGRTQTAMIIALILAEVCCILGMLLFFLGGSAAETYRLFGATLAVDMLFILPQVVRYV